MLNIYAEAYQLNLHQWGKVVCEWNWKWTAQEHLPITDYDLWYVWGGQGEVFLNEKRYPVSKGSCFLFRPGDLASADHNPDEPLVVTYIHFLLPVSPEIVPNSYRAVFDSYEFEWLLNRYVHAMSDRMYGAENEAQLVLKQLMILLLRDAAGREEEPLSKENYRVHQAMHEMANYIRQNAGNRYRIEELAQRIHLSRRYFSATFKQLFGQTIESFIIRTRIDRAEYLLRNSGMNVTEVAEALGYHNIYFFSRQFKQVRGMYPSVIKRDSR